VDGFIVPSAWIGRPVRGLPHMFTDEELAAFFRAADSIAPGYRSPFREYTIPVIFRLILGTGLRPLKVIYHLPASWNGLSILRRRKPLMLFLRTASTDHRR
jgi:hypothetical protein